MTVPASAIDAYATVIAIDFAPANADSSVTISFSPKLAVF
jgi:hypothetical protein